VALLTYGEGYHNFHHMFAHDYRNGVSAWALGSLEVVHRIHELAGVGQEFEARAVVQDSARADRCPIPPGGTAAIDPAGREQIEHLKRRVAEEYEVFCCALDASSGAALVDAKRVMLERWERSILQSRLQELEHGLKTSTAYAGAGAQIAFTVA